MLIQLSILSMNKSLTFLVALFLLTTNIISVKPSEAQQTTKDKTLDLENEQSEVFLVRDNVT